MSKDYLEALEILYNNAKLDRDRIEEGGVVTYAEEIEHNEGIKPYYKTLKQALQRLEAIDNANPSEALRELSIIRHLEIGFDKNRKPITLNDIDGLNTIKNCILKAQEQEKVLKIIFKKKVDIVYLEDSNTVEEYNSHFGAVICKLTQEEFDLLNRWTNGKRIRSVRKNRK